MQHTQAIDQLFFLSLHFYKQHWPIFHLISLNRTMISNLPFFSLLSIIRLYNLNNYYAKELKEKLNITSKERMYAVSGHCWPGMPSNAPPNPKWKLQQLQINYQEMLMINDWRSIQTHHCVILFPALNTKDYSILLNFTKYPDIWFWCW